MLNKVAVARIIDCLFVFNTPGINSLHLRVTEFISDLTIRRYFNLPDNVFLTFGGALLTTSSNVLVTNTKFILNKADLGGVLFGYHSNITMTQCTNSYNSAYSDGGVMFTVESSVNVTSSNSTNNSAGYGGAVIATLGGSNSITSSDFTENTSQGIGVMFTSGGSFNISSSIFTKNTADISGAVIFTSGGTFNIISSKFTSNTAVLTGGVVFSLGDGVFEIICSNFTNNTAEFGGVMVTDGGSFNISNSSFTDNSATLRGGVIYTVTGSYSITVSNFTNNKANEAGGVIWSDQVSLNIHDSSFSNNTADSYGGIMFTILCSTHITDSTFYFNSGSLYTFNSNLTFSGHSKFENCIEPSNKTSLTSKEGGAVTSFQSTVILNGVTTLSNNQARQGGAVLASESTIVFYGRTIIVMNMATVSNGGGLSLRHSDLEIKGNVMISDNYAEKGGGLHARSSTITVYEQGTLHFGSNRAENGSGMYLEVNPNVYLLKKEFKNSKIFLTFTGNNAKFGGAVYMADDTNSGACSLNIQCFIQILALYRSGSSSTVGIQFSGNNATERGSNLYGGLLDRCVPSSFAEVYIQLQTSRTQNYNGAHYLQDLSNIALHWIHCPLHLLEFAFVTVKESQTATTSLHSSKLRRRNIQCVTCCS